MAERYLAALRSVQPHGPYLLAGRCNGATVAYEIAQRLRAEGEEVPLLAALDSDPPPAEPGELAPDIPYDPVMESAWMRARKAGEEAPDPGEPARLLRWLGEPAGPGVSRYLHEAWRWREDLERAWPDPLGADARAVAEWGWDHGPRELGLVRALLIPRPARAEPASERVRRARALGFRVARKIETEARRSAVDVLEKLLDRPLPHARERIERKVVAAAQRARESYRAEPWPGRVLLVTSPEFEDKPTYPAWDCGLAAVSTAASCRWGTSRCCASPAPGCSPAASRTASRRRCGDERRLGAGSRATRRRRGRGPRLARRARPCGRPPHPPPDPRSLPRGGSGGDRVCVWGNTASRRFRSGPRASASTSATPPAWPSSR